MQKLSVIGFLLLGSLYFSCTPSLYIPANTDATQQEALMAGRKLYVTHCSGCHNLYLPKQFTAEKWHENLAEMQPRAGLSDDEVSLILEYLTFQPVPDNKSRSK